VSERPLDGNFALGLGAALLCIDTSIIGDLVRGLDRN